MDEMQFGAHLDANAPCEPFVRGPTGGEHTVLPFRLPPGSRAGRRLQHFDRIAVQVEHLNLPQAGPPGDAAAKGDSAEPHVEPAGRYVREGRAVLIPRREAELLGVERYRAVDIPRR